MKEFDFIAINSDIESELATQIKSIVKNYKVHNPKRNIVDVKVAYSSLFRDFGYSIKYSAIITIVYEEV
jgi:hypothetical protein